MQHKPIKFQLLTALILITFIITSDSRAQAFTWLSKPDQQAGMALNGSSGFAKISANGRFIAFSSEASNIVTGDTNQQSDLYLHDNINQTTQRIALSAGLPDLRAYSAPTSDGRYITVSTNRDEIIGGRNYVYLYDTIQNTFTLLNTNLVGDRFDLIFSDIYLADNASQIIFETSENLSPLHTDSSNQIYAKNLNTNDYTLLSVASDGSAANGGVDLLDVSVNQQFIALDSGATNLLPGITLNNRKNLIILDLSVGSYQLASILPDGTSSFSGFWRLRSVSVSNSGKVAYFSDMDDIVTGDNNDAIDAFYFDGSTNHRISLDNNGQELPLGGSIRDIAVISPNDSFISFSNFSDQIVTNDNNETYDTFIYDINSGSTTRASSLASGQAANDLSFPAAISTNGQILLLNSYAKNYGLGNVINGQSQTFVYSMTQQQVTQMLPQPTLAVYTAHQDIIGSHISADQQTAFYISQSPYLSTDAVSNYKRFDSTTGDLFQLNRNTDTHSIIARKVNSDTLNGGGIDVSSSGQFVVFSSRHFQPAATFELSSQEVFLYDKSTNSFTQIGPGRDAKVNNGGMVVFNSESDLLPIDTNGLSDTYLYDSADNSINLVSKNTAGMTSSWGSENPFISDSITDVWVGFTSGGSDFINNDTNNRRDVFMYNWPSGNTIRVSQIPDGTGGDDNSGNYLDTEISANGDFVVFTSRAQNLTNDDYTGAQSIQIFVYERATQELELISPNSGGDPFNTDQIMDGLDISDSGRYVSFSLYDELDDYGISDSAGDVFLFDQQTQLATLLSEGVNTFNSSGTSVNPQVVEDLSLSPPLLGVIFDGASLLTGIDEHSGHQESFLYQQGGPNVELTIEVLGMGTVSGSLGVNCMTTCDSNYPLGTELNLLAVPDGNFVFDRWYSTRSSCANTQNCTVTMDREKTLQAIFIDQAEIVFVDGFE